VAELLVQHAYRRSRKRRQTGRTRAVCGKVSRLREGFSRNVLYSLAWIDGKARCSGSYDERGSVASNRLRSDEDLPSGFPFSSKGRPISVGPRLSKGRQTCLFLWLNVQIPPISSRFEERKAFAVARSAFNQVANTVQCELSAAESFAKVFVVPPVSF